MPFGVIALAIGPEDTAYALDELGRRVIMFDTDGEQTSIWSLQDDAAGLDWHERLDGHASIALAPDDTLVVAEESGQIIRR